MVKKEFVLLNKYGLHARPAALLVQVANQFVSDIFISVNHEKVNCKSIMGIMMLALGFGTNFEISIEGKDENSAMEAILNLIEGDLRGSFENS